MNDFDSGYKAGYNKAYAEMYVRILSKIDTSPVDEMYGRYPEGATGIPFEHNMGKLGPTGPTGYIP